MQQSPSSEIIRHTRGGGGGDGFGVAVVLLALYDLDGVLIAILLFEGELRRSGVMMFSPPALGGDRWRRGGGGRCLGEGVDDTRIIVIVSSFAIHSHVMIKMISWIF
mmetsp:Transcript_30737/g.64996  ORF Transcript_30737/g.64996 Transcript_30737/m.64996 type:complete len:107 (+) Transcript_30737:124-444(+)